MVDHASDIHKQKAMSKDKFYTADRETREHGDTVAALEVPRIKAGNYKLQIDIPKAAFVFTSMYETCLSFDLQIEYLALNKD